MEFPRLTEEQLRLNNSEFNALIANVRKYSGSDADRLMMNRNPIDNHVKAQEVELEVIEQFHIAKLRIADRRSQHVR